MNKFFLPALLIGFFLFYGCKKNNASPSTTNSQWTIFGKTYTADTTFFNNDDFEMRIEAYDSANNAAFVSFRTKPVTNRKYIVINAGSITTALDLDSNQCVINAIIPGNSYYSVGEGSSVSVTLSGTKLNVSFSNVKVKNGLNGSDSTTFSGNLHEQ